VIDEAHGVCGDSGRHGVADALARRSRRLLLLTATPHSGDESRFERLLDLGALPCAGDDVLVFRRTRAGLGASNGRRVRWHAVSLTAEEVRLHDVLAGFEGAVLHAAGEGRRDAALLLLSVFRKRALSTIAAFLLSVERRLSWLDASGSVDPQPWRQGDLDFDESADDLSTEERIAIDADIGLGADRERSWLRRLIDLGRAASRHDSKIRRVVALARRSTEPLALFTEFKDSLDVLAARLRPLHRIATLHGRLTADEQQEQIDRFLDGSASILLATDVASQGLNLQSRCRWIVNLELPWNPAKLEQRAGRVDRIGQRRSVHISLLVARHGTEADVLLRLARRALSAQQTFGSEMLGVTAPDEHVLRAHLLSSAPLPPPEPPRRRVAFCRKWSRPARAAAQRLRRQKSLASHWRGHLPASRPGVSRLDRLAGLRAIAGDTSLVLFSVPLMSGSGTRLEHRLVMIRVPATALHAPRGLDRLREVATMSLHPRVRRLRRLRNSERDGAVSRERAIADALAAPFRPAAYQAGLFDRRGLLADTRAARVLERIARDLDDRLLGIDTDCAVEIGIPILELIALPPR
jgi:superfamily II DNA or RNA helicase